MFPLLLSMPLCVYLSLSFFYFIFPFRWAHSSHFYHFFAIFIQFIFLICSIYSQYKKYTQKAKMLVSLGGSLVGGCYFLCTKIYSWLKNWKRELNFMVLIWFQFHFCWKIEKVKKFSNLEAIRTIRHRCTPNSTATSQPL